MKGGCFTETLRISETDCDAMRAAGLTAALEGKLQVHNNQATKIVSGWSSMRKAFKQFAFAQVAPPDDFEESDNDICTVLASRSCTTRRRRPITSCRSQP